MGAKAFGQETPTQGETAVSWQTWSDGSGGAPLVAGDADWGKLAIPLSGGEGRSAVYDQGSVGSRQYTLTSNRYGVGSSGALLQIRGSETVFTQDAVLPQWETYSAPIARAWRYYQVREIAGLVELPQNLLLQDDVALEGFETAGDWTAGAGSLAANTTQYKAGSQSIKLTAPSGGTGQMTKTVSWAGIDYEFFSFWFYLHDSHSAYTSIKFYISSTTDFSKSFNYTIDPGVSGLLSWPAEPYMIFRIPLSSMTNTGSESWDNEMIRIRFEVVSASGVISASFDDLVGGYKRIPVILFRHDGVYDNLIDNGAFAHYEALGMVGDAYISCRKTYEEDAARLTEAEVQTLYAAGWSINVYLYGFTSTAYGMGDLTQAAQEYQIGMGGIYIREILGCPGGERHFTFTGGGTLLNNSLTEAALAATQALTAVGPYGALNRQDYFPPGNLYNIAFQIMGARTLADAKAEIDYTILHGQYLIMNFDELDATGQTTADHIAWLDYIYEKWAAGEIYPITMNQFYKLTLGPVWVGKAGNKSPNIASGVSAWDQPDTIIDIDHEGNNLNEYEITSTDGGNLSVAAAAALNGSNYGLSIHYNANTTAKYAGHGISLLNETDVRFRFFYNPNTITLVSTLQQIFTTSSGSAAHNGIHMLNVVHKYASGDYRLRLGIINDAHSATTGTEIIITNAAHRVEVQCHRASSSVAADGWASMWIDGNLESTISDIDNYDLFEYTDVFYVGAVTSGNASNDGTFYMDEIIANVTGEEIGA